jgi:hypothetical protein
MRGPGSRKFLPLAALVWLLTGLPAQQVSAQAPPAVQLFDTRSASSIALTSGTLATRDTWRLLPEDQTRHAFQGDVVVSNGKLAFVLRRQGRGAEVYAATPKGWVMRAELVPVAGAPAASLSEVRISENDSSRVAVDAAFSTAGGAPLTLGYELKVGQIFVETQPRSGATALRVVAPSRFAVLPDFFADDIVVDAAELPVASAELPGDNFLLHLQGEGEALVMAVWHPAKDDVRITLAGQGAARTLTGSEIAYGTGGRIWIAVLDGPGTWHRRDIAADDGGKILRLDWRAPYAAHWRVDWQRDDRLNDSWEMLTQQPDGHYVKHGWYGQPESFGNVDWQQGGRGRWTTVLGGFQYPCWVDLDGTGYLQPLKKGVRFLGPALLYPINRLEATPLETFTVVDVMRATLGVGPCEYILDVEGQKKTYQGRPTCASRTILDNIYQKKQQKQKRAEVLQTLDEVIAFMRHIRGRIENYTAFGHEVVALLEAEKKAQPELAGLLTELQDITRKMDSYRARRADGIKTPEFATRLVTDFRTTLVDCEGDDALAQCKKLTAAMVDIGGHQDELVGECRMVVKILRQRAALTMAGDPRLAPVSKELRRRTQQMLRSPASYEAPRH